MNDGCLLVSPACAMWSGHNILQMDDAGWIQWRTRGLLDRLVGACNLGGRRGRVGDAELGEDVRAVGLDLGAAHAQGVAISQLVRPAAAW
jgi:hypothetical protein